MAAFTATAFTGAKLQTRAQVQTRATRTVAVCQMQETGRKALSLAAALAAAVVISVPAAHADLTSDLLAKSLANAELHNKQRLATSYANLARTRTVTDGTCQFPGNVLGCDVGIYAGDVAFIADDAKLECSGKDAGKCASKISIPQKNQ